MSTILLDLVTSTLQDVVAALDRGQISSVNLLRRYIDANNIEGLGLRAVIELAPRDRLLEQAKKLDEERLDGRPRSRLHGVPVLIKDVINTHPSMGMQNTAGMIVLEDSIVERSASLVVEILKAGMIILGKANLTVLNNWYGSHPNGWSPRGGQTASYLNPKMDPSGSSAGSAVSLSAGFCSASIGVETCGSIIAPALRAGLYAMKPTLGLVPSDALIGLSAQMDCPGPMGKSTWDIAAMLECMAVPSREFVKYAEGPYADISTTPIRLGIHSDSLPRSTRGVETSLIPEVQVQWEKALRKLAPVVKTSPADIPDVELLFGDENAPYSDYAYDRLLETDTWVAFNGHLRSIENCKVRNLEELVRWNEENPDRAFHNPSGEKQQNMLVDTLERGGTKDDSYQWALDVSAWVAANMEQLFQDEQIDVLAFPAGLSCSNPVVAATAGYPLATVPISQVGDGWPCGMQLIALRGQEEKLIAAMAACESVFQFKPKRVCE